MDSKYKEMRYYLPKSFLVGCEEQQVAQKASRNAQGYNKHH